MKKSEIIVFLLVFCTFFVLGCLKVGNERTSRGFYSKNLNIQEEKNIRATVSSLHQKYNIRFFVLRTTPFAYKLKVDGDVNLNNIIEDLERVELDGEKYLGILSPRAKQKSFNRKLHEKLNAIRSFLENHSTDSSYFLKEAGKACPDISGDYKIINRGGSKEVISIRSKGCQVFEVSRSQQNKGPVIKLQANQKCRNGQGYYFCSRGYKTAAGHIEFSFFERWEAQSCTKENWLRIDEKGKSLTSKVRQNCKGVETTIYEDEFLKLEMIN